jgi:hypothetical protein
VFENTLVQLVDDYYVVVHRGVAASTLPFISYKKLNILVPRYFQWEGGA